MYILVRYDLTFQRPPDEVFIAKYLETWIHPNFGSKRLYSSTAVSSGLLFTPNERDTSLVLICVLQGGLHTPVALHALRGLAWSSMPHCYAQQTHARYE